jgi:carboxylesterase type B
MFLHGGDNYVGGSNDEKLHAYHLASTMNMVVVTINYRQPRPRAAAS